MKGDVDKILQYTSRRFFIMLKRAIQVALLRTFVTSQWITSISTVLTFDVWDFFVLFKEDITFTCDFYHLLFAIVFYFSCLEQILYFNCKYYCDVRTLLNVPAIEYLIKGCVQANV